MNNNNNTSYSVMHSIETIINSIILSFVLIIERITKMLDHLLFRDVVQNHSELFDNLIVMNCVHPKYVG